MNRLNFFLLVGILTSLVWGCGDNFPSTGNMTISSSDFKANEAIPKIYTCDGESIAPMITWAGFPADTDSMVLIMEDRSSFWGDWVHWLVYDIRKAAKQLPSGFSAKGNPGIAKEGKGDSGRIGYYGPCPKKGDEPHRYRFSLYALDIDTLDLPEGESKKNIYKAMKGHVLDHAVIIGTYGR